MAQAGYDPIDVLAALSAGDVARRASSPPRPRRTARRGTSPAASPPSTTSAGGGPVGTSSRPAPRSPRPTSVTARTPPTTTATGGPASSSRSSRRCGTAGTTTPSSPTPWRGVGRPGQAAPAAHRGEHYSVAGILGFPRSPQGHPLLVQAGSSPQGVDLAGRFADLVFTPQSTIADGIAFRRRLQEVPSRTAGTPTTCARCPACRSCSVGPRRRPSAAGAQLQEASDPTFRLFNLANLAGRRPDRRRGARPRRPVPVRPVRAGRLGDVRPDGHAHRPQRRPDVPPDRRALRDAARRPAPHRDARAARRPHRGLVAGRRRRRVHAATPATAGRRGRLRRPRRADPASAAWPPTPTATGPCAIVSACAAPPIAPFGMPLGRGERQRLIQ